MIPVCTPWYPGNEAKYVGEAVKEGLVSGSAGRFIPDFENSFSKYCNVRYGVSCTSGSTALHLACEALELREGDEVIVTTFTNIASINGIILSGAKPVLVDIEADTWNMNAKKIEEKITEKTKAIMPVHIYGHPCEMDSILKLAKKNNLYIIEDVAEAHGAEYKGRKCGSFSDVACFSFYSNKIINTGEGGMCLTQNEGFAEKLRTLRNLHFGIPRFLHHGIGFNYRMSNLHAAIGLAQTENIEKLVEARRNIGLKYNKQFKDIKELILPVEKEYAKNVYWMYGVVLNDNLNITKEQVMSKLKDKGIDTRSFFIPMHKQPAFIKSAKKNSPDCSGEFLIADKISERGFYLPTSSNLTDKEIAYISDSLKEIISRN